MCQVHVGDSSWQHMRYFFGHLALDTYMPTAGSRHDMSKWHSSVHVWSTCHAQVPRGINHRDRPLVRRRVCTATLQNNNRYGYVIETVVPMKNETVVLPTTVQTKCAEFLFPLGVAVTNSLISTYYVRNNNLCIMYQGPIHHPVP